VGLDGLDHRSLEVGVFVLLLQHLLKLTRTALHADAGFVPESSRVGRDEGIP
jgi:hypothetical protein